MSESPIKPLTDHVVVRVEEPPEQTSGGLHIPSKHREAVGRGEVLAVGSGKVFSSGRRVSLDVSVGDVVVFPAYAGVEISWGESRETVLLLRERDIHGILNKT